MFLRLQKWDSEEKLVRACQRGDAAAQREIYDRFARRMLGVCARYFTNQMEAEDVMIGGFMRVFEKIAQYQFAGSFEGWVRRVMVTEALQQVRRNKSLFQEVGLAEADLAGAHADSHAFPPPDALETEDLLALVQQLPDGYRTVFNLYAIEGYSHREIADQLGISENTSKSQLSRARAWLQDSLLRQHTGPHHKPVTMPTAQPGNGLPYQVTRGDGEKKDSHDMGLLPQTPGPTTSQSMPVRSMAAPQSLLIRPAATP